MAVTFCIFFSFKLLLSPEHLIFFMLVHRQLNMEKKKCSKQQPQDLYTSEKVLLHQYTAETPQQKN